MVKQLRDRSQADTIARLLAMFIDPQGQSFREDVLIDQYDYPQDDLLDVDMDWM